MSAYDRPLFPGEHPFRARLSLDSLLSRGFVWKRADVTILGAPRHAGCR
ncbi:hypothetical protein [Nocardia amamiensis]